MTDVPNAEDAWPNASTAANADHLLPPVDWKARAAQLRQQQAADPECCRHPPLLSTAGEIAS